MSERQQPDREQDAADTGEYIELLDSYVDSLQAGDDQSRHALLRQHPELSDVVDCLDGLDRLAPESRRPAFEIDLSGPAPGSDDTSTDFGKYELLGIIGRGGMGVVYKARQKDLDRIVALKMVLSSQFASDEELRRFHIEAQAAGNLKHPNIVGIHEVGQEHGQHYFSMDCIQGSSLEGLLKNGPDVSGELKSMFAPAVTDDGLVQLEPDMAAKCLFAVTRAVDYLHSQNIVHRDLKPSNILLDETGQPYVTDFGLAKVFQPDSKQTQSGTIIGTPSYMAPEQATGRSSGSRILPQSDIYSLGAILYEMLTGRPPFKEDNPLDTLMQVLEGEPELPGRLNPSVPRALELICMRCLEKEPVGRYESAADLADDLDRFLKREPVEARPSDLWQNIRRWVRREPALLSHLIGLSAAASIVQARHMISGSAWDYHVKIMSTLGVWAVVSFLFQKLLNHERTTAVARFAWSTADACLLTVALCLADGPRGPLLIGYPMLVAASGLFFRVRLVWFMTFVCLVSYAILVHLRPEEATPAHYPIIFAAVLAVLGVVVAYQVYRIRVLSRYFESRRLP